MRFMMLMIPNVKDENWMPGTEAVAAMTKFADGDAIEVLQVFEMSDFPPEVQKAAAH